jgi:hypothetical protein
MYQIDSIARERIATQSKASDSSSASPGWSSEGRHLVLGVIDYQDLVIEQRGHGLFFSYGSYKR